MVQPVAREPDEGPTKATEAAGVPSRVANLVTPLTISVITFVPGA